MNPERLNELLKKLNTGTFTDDEKKEFSKLQGELDCGFTDRKYGREHTDEHLSNL